MIGDDVVIASPRDGTNSCSQIISDEQSTMCASFMAVNNASRSTGRCYFQPYGLTIPPKSRAAGGSLTRYLPRAALPLHRPCCTQLFLIIPGCGVPGQGHLALSPPSTAPGIALLAKHPAEPRARTSARPC